MRSELKARIDEAVAKTDKFSLDQLVGLEGIGHNEAVEVRQYLEGLGYVKQMRLKAEFVKRAKEGT